MTPSGSTRDARAVLDERARELARVPPAPLPEGHVLGVVTFSLGAERYAVESRLLCGIVRVADVTPVPGVPACFAGVTNVRGAILALVDLRLLHGIGVQGLTDLSRVLVLGAGSVELGLLADAVHEVTSLRRDELLAPPELAPGTAPDHVLGVTRDALVVLDGEALLADPRLFVGHGADPTETGGRP